MSQPFQAMRGGEAPATTGGQSFVAIAEVERFLPLRQRIGYASGNAVLRVLADRVTAMVPGASVGRINRTALEFAFAAADRSAAEALLHAAIASLQRAVVVEGLSFAFQITIGAAAMGARPIDDAAIDVAAAALADAQARHERVVIRAATSSAVRADGDIGLLRDMPEAMVSGALQVHYQPKLRTRTNRIEGAEALIRWTHPDRGPVAIEPFIRLVEEAGAIGTLTEWVIARAVTDCAMMADQGHEIVLWVNISGALVPDRAFIDRALDLVRGSEHKIGFEITETAVIDDPERALANLAAVNAAGIKLAIDDYGSGLSSLAYLKQLPAQELKIDRMFIKELVHSHRDPLLVRSSIDLAHALEMEVTAEGVDDPMALALLRVMGCDLIQGYIVAPALPPSELLGLLGDHDRLDRLAAPQRALWGTHGAIAEKRA